MTRKRHPNGQFAPGNAGKNPPAAPHRPTANPDYARAMHDLRSSGAAGTHLDKRDKRARTRGAAKARDLRDQAF